MKEVNFTVENKEKKSLYEEVSCIFNSKYSMYPLVAFI